MDILQFFFVGRNTSMRGAFSFAPHCNVHLEEKYSVRYDQMITLLGLLGIKIKKATILIEANYMHQNFSMKYLNSYLQEIKK